MFTVIKHRRKSFRAVAAAGYLIDENFDDNLLPSDWTFTSDVSPGNIYTVSGGLLYAVNGSDYVTFDVPAAMQDEFWVKALIDDVGGTNSKSSWHSLIEVLDSSSVEFIKAQFWGAGAPYGSGTYRLDGATTVTSLAQSIFGNSYYVWFHFVKNGTSELWVSQSSTRPTTDSTSECVISCSTNNTSADKIKLMLGYANGARPIYWDFFIGDESDTEDAAPNENFEFTVTTTSSNETFTIPCQNVGTFNATVDWGDGSTSTITAYNDADLAHTYATAGDHDISISGTFPNIYFYDGGDKLKVKSVTNLGSVGLTRLNRAFYGCSNMTSFTPGDCDTSSVTDMNAMFINCTSLTSLDLSSFTTSSVTDMSNMFNNCSSLTSLDVSSFNTSSVTNIAAIFYNCSFTSLDLSNFNTSSVTNMNGLFRDCSSLTSVDLSSFNTSSVLYMDFLFDGCSSLTSVDLSSFNTSSVQSMRNMFYGMGGGTAQLTITGIEDFDITSLVYFFFNPVRIGGFVDGLTNTGGISTTVYDELLVNWEAQTGYATNIEADFGPSKYTANSTAATARADLITTGWTITDGGTA